MCWVKKRRERQRVDWIESRPKRANIIGALTDDRRRLGGGKAAIGRPHIRGPAGRNMLGDQLFDGIIDRIAATYESHATGRIPLKRQTPFALRT